MIRKILTAFLFLVMLSLTSQSMAKGKRVLFIGDSITDGAWGNSNVWNATTEQRNQQDMNHIYGHGYMMLVASYYQATYPEDEWIFWNRGISGNTLDDLAERWQNDVLALNPDVVSILVGTNDVEQALNEGRSVDSSSWSEKLSNLIDQVKQQNPDAVIMLCTPFVAQAGWRGESENYSTRKEMIHSLVKAIEAIGRNYKAHLVPFHTLVDETIDSTPNLPVSYWIWDGIHPTPAMHYRMAELWKQKFENMN